jgi:hypothetical protein
VAGAGEELENDVKKETNFNKKQKRCQAKYLH